MSFDRYNNYRASGVEWLDEVPSHWDVAEAKRFLTVQSGDMISASEETDDGYPIIGGNGVRGYTHKFNSNRDTLVIGRVGALCGCVHHIETDFWASEHAYRVIERKPINKRFFFHLLGALNLNRLAIKTAQPLLNTTIVESQVIAVPPASEQAVIAAFLDYETRKIDALVEEQKRLVALLKEKRQAVISQAVTKGLNPNVPVRDTGVEWLGEAPAHWQVKRMAELFSEVAEPGSDELPILSVSIHDGVSDDEIAPDDMDRKVTRSEDRSKYKRVQPNDLVYNMMRAWQGGFGAVEVEGAVSPAYVVARPKQHGPTKFIEWLLRTPTAVEEMRRCSKGVTDFRLRLYWDEFKDMKIAVPPAPEREVIVAAVTEMVERWDALADEAKTAIGLLQERRSALISAAVTGKIDVRGLVPNQAEAA